MYARTGAVIALVAAAALLSACGSASSSDAYRLTVQVLVNMCGPEQQCSDLPAPGVPITIMIADQQVGHGTTNDAGNAVVSMKLDQNQRESEAEIVATSPMFKDGSATATMNLGGGDGGGSTMWVDLAEGWGSPPE